MFLILAFFMFFMSTVWIDYTQIDLNQIKQDKINVIVRGAVVSEKLLELDHKAVFQDAIRQVQLTNQANILVFNPLQKLKDNDVITIPEKQNNCISINNATISELVTLNGIGQESAKRIISYREENGFFQSLEELQKVKGIGPSTFAKIKMHICL